MTDQPYTDTDLRAEATRQHADLTRDPDYMGVGEQMEGQEVTPGGEINWDDYRDETFEAAQRSIHDLLTGAADVSQWAIDLGADGLEPTEHTIQLGVDPEDGDRPRIRMHFAFSPDMDDDARTQFVMALSRAIARDIAA